MQEETEGLLVRIHSTFVARSEVLREAYFEPKLWEKAILCILDLSGCTDTFDNHSRQ